MVVETDSAEAIKAIKRLTSSLARHFLIRIGLTTVALLGATHLLSNGWAWVGEDVARNTRQLLATLAMFLATTALIPDYAPGAFGFLRDLRGGADSRARSQVTDLACVVICTVAGSALPAALWLGSNAAQPGWFIGPTWCAVLVASALTFGVLVLELWYARTTGDSNPFSALPFTRMITICLAIWIGVACDIALVGRLTVTESIKVATQAAGANMTLAVAVAHAARRLPGNRIPRGSNLLFFGVMVLVAWIVNSWLIQRELAQELDNSGAIATVMTTPIVFMGLSLVSVAVHSPETQQRHAGRWFRMLMVDAVRAQLLGLSIVQRYAAVFATAFPVSLWLWTTPEAKTYSVQAILTGATFAWLAPFVGSLVFIGHSYRRAYQLGLKGCVQRLHDHVVVLGFGDIGRRLVRDLISKGTIAHGSTFDHISMTRNVLLSDGRLAKVLLRIAVVDMSQEHVTGAIESGTAGLLAIAPMTETLWSDDRVSPDRSRFMFGGMRCEAAIPVIVGDGTDNEVQRAVRLESAAFVASTLRSDDSSERSQSVLASLERLHRQGVVVPAALAVHSSAYLAFASDVAVSGDLPVHCIYPEALEGASAGNMLYACYRKWQEVPDSARFPRIILCGRGRRMFHAVDTLFRNFSDKELEDIQEKQSRAAMTGRLSEGCLFMVTTDEALIRQAHRCLTVADPDLLNGKLLKLPFERYTTRTEQSRDGNNSKAKVDILLLEASVSDISTARDVLREIEPHVVFFGDHTGEQELALLTSFVNGVEGLGLVGARRPQMLISCETGRRYVTGHFARTLLYYQADYDKYDKEDPCIAYPGLGLKRLGPEGHLVGPSLIDVLDEPVERIVGLVDAYGAGSGRGGKASEVSYCNSDTHGSMAAVVSKLAGVSPEAPGANLSITNTRLVAISKHEFSLRSFALLGPQPEERASVGHDKSRREASVRVRQPDSIDSLSEVLDDFRENQGRSRSVRDSKELLRRWALDDDLPGETKKKVEGILTQFMNAGDSGVLEAVQECCGMPTCPVEAVHKSVLSCVNHRKYVAEKIKDPRWMEFESSRMAVVDAYKQKDLIPGHYEANPVVAREATRGELGHITMVCRRADLGTFATALNALLFSKVREPEERRPFGTRTNLTYVSASGCHDHKFGVFTCYGRSADNNARAVTDVGQVITRVTISPVGGSKSATQAWKRYAYGLNRFLNKSGAEFVIQRFADPTGTGWRIENRRNVGAEARRGGDSSLRPADYESAQIT